ncbi:MAG: hypothetical protein COB20_04275 [SAR86 cluster bacterium]|uniref:START domain-containing protein n=1 Tax=SAR86 cluster bacterium TaxID=2030880 RepID=A0A2A4XBJ8_9GAMM|nr:MAG: hypothetical protein COB20_04275 [SAR86 cluster bacterium]
MHDTWLGSVSSWYITKLSALGENMNIAQRLIKLSILLAACASGYLFAAEAQDWELRRDRDGIQVHTRPVEGSPYDAVRTTTRMTDVRLSSLVALIEDAPACADWADSCAESYLVERLSDSESLVYTHNDMPFPVKDRDVLAQVKWTQNSATFEVEMNSVATVGKIDDVRGRLRLTKAVASWNFAPQADGSVLISNQAHINPGSALPGWVTNMLLIDAPFETMRSFVNEVRNSKYVDAQLSFIREPAP